MSIARTLFFLCLFCCHSPRNVSLDKFVPPSLDIARGHSCSASQSTQSGPSESSTPLAHAHLALVLTPPPTTWTVPTCLPLPLPLCPPASSCLSASASASCPASPAWPRHVHLPVRLYLSTAPPSACRHWPAILCFISRHASSTLRFHRDPTWLNLPGWACIPLTHAHKRARPVHMVPCSPPPVLAPTLTYWS